MNIIFIIFLCISQILACQAFSKDAQADTLILKSGRRVTCEKIHKQDEVVKCMKDDVEIGYPADDVEEIIQDNVSNQDRVVKGFIFDIWHSGMSIEELMNTAERNDIPLLRQGLIAVNKHYNPKFCREYINSATQFYYKDHLMGKNATITLYLTPASKLLEKIKVTLHYGAADQKSSCRKEIETMLSEKYGRPSPVTIGKFFPDSLIWKMNKDFDVLAEFWPGQIDISYSDIHLRLIGQREQETIQAEEREQYHKKDAVKF